MPGRRKQKEGTWPKYYSRRRTLDEKRGVLEDRKRLRGIIWEARSTNTGVRNCLMTNAPAQPPLDQQWYHFKDASNVQVHNKYMRGEYENAKKAEYNKQGNPPEIRRPAYSSWIC
jgi:hypothetical protein